MKAAKATLLALMALLGVMASAGAWAQHHHHHGGVRFGVFVGAPAFWYSPYYSPYYYPPYYYYHYPRTVVPAGPTTYVEQGQPEPAPAQAAPAAPASSYWYFCRESGAYYPYVNQCAGPWERVNPRPPS